MDYRASSWCPNYEYRDHFLGQGLMFTGKTTLSYSIILILSIFSNYGELELKATWPPHTSLEYGHINSMQYASYTSHSNGNGNVFIKWVAFRLSQSTIPMVDN